jgi:hypothetical protein
MSFFMNRFSFFSSNLIHANSNGYFVQPNILSNTIITPPPLSTNDADGFNHSTVHHDVPHNSSPSFDNDHI